MQGMVKAMESTREAVAPIEGVLGLIGCGQMGGALLRGWLASGVVAPANVRLSDPSTGAAVAAKMGLVATDAASLVAEANVILLAVKPHLVDLVTRDLKFRPEQVVVSIAAGLSSAHLSAACAPARVVRTMPNVASAVGAGVTLVLEEGVAPADVDLACRLMGAVGQVERLASEAWFHPGTGVSGCGPAFMFLALEAMADAGVAEGLPRAMAERIAAGTMLGAGALAKGEGGSAAVLKDRVTSPGGATIQGVRTLEIHGFRTALFEAVVAATAKARALEQP
jgi:pyrroline-5-carboxylate reductase